MGISGKKEATNQMVYAADVAFKNIFDTRKPESRKIFQNEFFGKWGNGTELSERGLPDWTDSIDLEEFLKEKYGDKFDGLVLDEGGVPVGNDVLLRPESYVPFSSDQIRILPSAETSGAPSPGGLLAEDAKYLELAQYPEKNRDEIQRMVDVAEAEYIQERFSKKAIKGGYGLRAIDGHTVAVGDVLRSSNRWENDKKTKRVLSGTSGISFGKTKTEQVKALNLMGIVPPGFGKNYFQGYWGEQLALVKGSTYRKGYDASEIVIRDAVVVDVIPNPYTEKAVRVIYDAQGNIIPLSERFPVSPESPAPTSGAEDALNSQYDTVTDEQARAELGRAQPLTAKVKTRLGWQEIGELAPGDEIAGPEGGWQFVLAIYPQGSLPVSRITLDSGAATEASADHLWRYSSPATDDKVGITLDLREGFMVPVVA
jgi:hypothetical protein